MTERDHFAAAALTGLLYHNHEPAKPVSWWTEQAYDYADAMLRERERARSYEKNDEARSFSDMEWSAIPKEKDASFSYNNTTSPPVAAPAGINRNAASQSPDVSVGGGEPLDDTRPDTKGEATGGRGQNIPDSRTRGRVGTILSEAEIDALEYVVVEGRIACVEDYGILRSLLVRVRPEWENA